MVLQDDGSTEPMSDDAAHGLTPREREITEMLVRGLSTAAIAATLWLSPYTVRDHVKAVFDTLGARSRPALTAMLFHEHYAVGSPRGQHEGLQRHGPDSGIPWVFPARAGRPDPGPQVSAIQLPWKPSGTRLGRWTRATGAPAKSCAARTTRSAAPRSGSCTKAMT